MKDRDLSARISEELTACTGYYGGELTNERRKALNYYLGEPFGNEVEGRSKMIERTVADVVDAILPQLARIFMASDEYVQFSPRNPNDQDKAAQATEFCNYVLEEDNNKFNIFYTWFKDALLQKNGIVKVYWDVENYETEEEYEGLNVEELMMVAQDPDVEITELEGFVLDLMGEAQEIEVDIDNPHPEALYNVKLNKLVEKGYPKVENIPPEDFLITRRASSINDASFVAHKRKTTESELIIEGYPKKLVKSIPSGDVAEYNDEKVARYNKDDEYPYDGRAEGSERVIWIHECYIRLDTDNDGKSELRRVVVGGNSENIILENETVELIPFCSVCPYPLPHKFYGESLYDKVGDVQLLKSTIWRQMLDNLYLINNGRTAINDNVNIDDLITSRPGGVVRMDNPQADWANMAPADVTRNAYPMLEYCDRVVKNRAGIDQNITGLDPNTLQEAKTGAVNRAFEASQMKIELIARVFAETGVSELFRKMLKMLVKFSSKERMIQIREEWVSMNPREWDDKMDVRVNVGLGTGNKEAQTGQLMNIIQLQRDGLPFGISSPDLIYNAHAKIVSNAGFKSEKEFFMRPPPPGPPQPPPPDPFIIAEQIKAQTTMQKASMETQAKSQTEQAKLMQDAQKAQYEQAVQQWERNFKEREQALKQKEILLREMEISARTDTDRARIQKELQQVGVASEALILQKYEIDKKYDTEMHKLGHNVNEAKRDLEIREDKFNRRAENFNKNRISNGLPPEDFNGHDEDNPAVYEIPGLTDLVDSVVKSNEKAEMTNKGLSERFDKLIKEAGKMPKIIRNKEGFIERFE